MIKTGLLGYPLGHSKSPQIHRHWFDQYGVSGQYDLIEIAPDDLSKEFGTLRSSGIRGVNVTIPHKESVLKLCDTLDDTARKIGAVNTVVFEGGKAKGYNTDAFGFFKNLTYSLNNFEASGKTAFVIGAGGAARAAIYALEQAGFTKIHITNRTRARADALAKDFKSLHVTDWEDRNSMIEKVDLIVNTTALGMQGHEALDLKLDPARAGAIIYDIVYNPLITPLLDQAKKHHLPIVTGIGMLVWQAAKAFELWHGVVPGYYEVSPHPTLSQRERAF